MAKYVVINDKTHKVMSEYAVETDAIEFVESRGYVRFGNGWTYRNPETRDYCHISSVKQYQYDSKIANAAARAGMTVDAYLQS